MSKFNWLHFSDLHFGMHGQSQLWPNIRQALFDDIAKQSNVDEPWNAIFFTGDVAQFGKRNEYEALDRDFLDPLRQLLADLGSEGAMILSVPGNHDLVRPASKEKPTAAERWMLNPELFKEISEDFWTDPDCEYRKIVEKAFSEYTKWNDRSAFTLRDGITEGLLPGDFSVTAEVENTRIGILGLNSSFLQLAAGDYKKKLEIDVRQFHAACGGDGVQWANEHDLCILLTHQGKDWFTRDCQTLVYPEINPAGRFAIHLFGHMHENVIRSSSIGGGKPMRLWQANSLFGMEKWGDPPVNERRHGYSRGQIEISGGSASLRHWPRKAVRDANGWRLVPDHEGTVLGSDDGTAPETVDLKRKTHRKCDRLEVIGGNRRGIKLLSDYRRTALEAVDIIDLASLPEGERALAMQRFALRQLYMPLRMRLQELEHSDVICDQDLSSESRLHEAMGRQLVLDFAEQSEDIESGYSLGEVMTRLSLNTNEPIRLVLLGDPGGGKTTILRWLSTAWFLKADRPQDVSSFPDAHTLPAKVYLPILVRCRHFDALGVPVALASIISETLRSMELKLGNSELNGLAELLMQMLKDGQAALLIDGLDEITNPQKRLRFFEHVETIATQYTSAPIIATSRIVSYRESTRRLGCGFHQATLLDVLPQDKDGFVNRWCDIVERDVSRRETEKLKLISGIHDQIGRVERLTGNPMLLTTMVLVHRKIGRLPAKRHKLYEEVVGVLLNWRSDVDVPIDADEAWPQLEYLAWAMCDRGIQRLRRDEVIELLTEARRDFPNIRAMNSRAPETFLSHLEARTSILVESGSVHHNGAETAVYEFRHLTIQEYFAGMALIRGHYRGHDPRAPLAARILPLSGKIGTNGSGGSGPNMGEPQVSENWREAIRLCVAACNDDDVNAAFDAIVGGDHSSVRGSSMSGDESRARAVLAGLCLADEPNVSAEMADRVITQIAASCRSGDGTRPESTNSLERAALELSKSTWAAALVSALVKEFMNRGPDDRAAPGALAGLLAIQPIIGRPNSKGELVSGLAGSTWINDRVAELGSDDDEVAIGSALAISIAAFERQIGQDVAVFELLLSLCSRGPAAAHAACWALGWLYIEKGSDDTTQILHYDSHQLERLRALMPIGEASAKGALTDPEALRWLVHIAGQSRRASFVESLLSIMATERFGLRRATIDALGDISDARALAPLLGQIHHLESSIRSSAARALGKLGDALAIESLSKLLEDSSATVRRAAIESIGQIGGVLAIETLLAALHDGRSASKRLVVAALSRIDDPHISERVKGAFEASGKEAKIAILAFFKGKRDQASDAFLMERLNDNDRRIRVEAFSMLVERLGTDADLRLISQDLDGSGPWLDPRQPLGSDRIAAAAAALSESEEETIRRVSSVWSIFGRRLPL